MQTRVTDVSYSKAGDKIDDPIIKTFEEKFSFAGLDHYDCTIEKYNGNVSKYIFIVFPFQIYYWPREGIWQVIINTEEELLMSGEGRSKKLEEATPECLDKFLNDLKKIEDYIKSLKDKWEKK